MREIKANELRLGNITKYGVIMPNDILNIYQMAQADVNPVEYEPIQLTEEWLIKFGFENNGQGIYDLKGWLPYLRKRKNNYQVYNVADCFIEYVHELQNLYFALTGEELVIRDLAEATNGKLKTKNLEVKTCQKEK
jgi:hypothetical protein